MSWLGFFKKEEIKIKLSLNESVSKINEEKDKLELKTRNIKKEIRHNLMLLISNLRLQIKVLRSIDLEHRKEHERIKIIVLENLSFYVSHLERLIENLEKIDETLDMDQYIAEIQNNFNRFKKESHNSFEKATVLIGRELEEVQGLIKKAFQNFNQIIDENKEIFEKIVLIKDLQNKIQEVHNKRKIQEEISDSINNLVKTKGELQTEKILIEKQYEDFKNSKKFREFIEQKEKTKKNQDELNQEVFRLKEKINIKFLLKSFHDNKERSNLLLGYRDNFLNALEEDKGLEIIKITKEVLNIDIDEDISSIKQRQLKVENKNDLEKEDNFFSDKIKNINLEIMNTKNQVEEENKKLIRFNEKEKQLIIEFNKQIKNLIGEVEITT